MLVAISMFGTTAEAVAQSACLVAQADAPGMEPSFASWFIGCVGLFGLLTLLAGMAVFLGACVVVVLSRRPKTIAFYRMFLLLPLLLGVAGAVKAGVSSLAVLDVPGVRISAMQVVAVVFHAALTPLGDALVVTLPSVLVLAIGQFVRTRRADRRPTVH
jgi:hypothetical protein